VSNAVRALLVGLACVALGCAHGWRRGERELQPGALELGGRSRTYLWWGPAHPGAPLVLALHGRFGDGRSMARLTGLTAVAKREGFTVVYPDGVERSWNDGRAHGPAAAQAVDDVAFLSALIDAFVARGSDPRRVYVTGMSNGAFMSVTLLCRAADKLAGAVAVTGALSANDARRCTPSRPVPLAFILGTEDPLVPFTGGPVASTRGETLSAEASARHFAAQYGCASEPQVEALPDVAANDGTRTERRWWPGCRAPARVELYAVQGGGHTWPLGRSALPARRVGPTSQDFSASEVAWRFFSGR
jgi:polyhydroxybutyrate depolymerase